MNLPILELRKVSQTYTSRDATGWGWTTVRAVDEVDLAVHQGETLAIVGESGSGKSTMAKLLLMLNRPTQGEAVYRGQPLSKLASAVRSEYRRNVQAVFQDPSASLNPRMTVEQSLGYVVRRHRLAPDARVAEQDERRLRHHQPRPRRHGIDRRSHGGHVSRPNCRDRQHDLRRARSSLHAPASRCEARARSPAQPHPVIGHQASLSRVADTSRWWMRVPKPLSLLD
jgi:ABC-type dipeptide/oligopeptide/nickel transport system ATPase subunit